MALADAFIGKKITQINNDQLKNATIITAKEISSPNDTQSIQKVIKAAASSGSGCLILIVKI